MVTLVILIGVLVAAVKVAYWLKEWNKYFTENPNDF